MPSGDVYEKVAGVWVLRANIATGPKGADGAPGASGGAELAYAEVVTPLSVTATTEATSQTIVAAPAITLDGLTTVMIDFFCCYAVPAAGVGAYMYFYLFDGSTSLGSYGLFEVYTSGTYPYQPISLHRRLTPSAGSHTYSCRVGANGGTGQVGAGTGGAGQYVPAFIRITKV